MKIVVDRLLCDSNGLCVVEAPGLLALDASEELMVLKTELADAELEPARRAVAICPKGALRIAD